MSSEYHIHGVEISRYSVKVRSYFRYKGIPHRWIPRNQDADGEYQKFAKLPLVPLVVTPTAIANGREEFSVALGGRTWSQKPQKYHARSLAALREKYRAVGGNRALDAILETSGCLAGLRA